MESAKTEKLSRKPFYPAILNLATRIQTLIGRQGYFQSGQHKFHEVLPAIEAQIPSQSAQVVKKSLSTDQFLPEQAVTRIEPGQNGMHQISQDVEAGQ